MAVGAAVVVALLAAGHARAAEPAAVGTVVAVSGSVEVGTGDSWAPAAPQQQLVEGQAIRTGEGSSAEVLFAPDTPASVGASTEIAVVDLLLKARLEQTRARLVAPASDAPRADVQVTPLTGVRGTERAPEKAGELKREHYWSEDEAPAAK